ncbi:MAG: ABC transporter ATP-binding protein [Planctomycetota bacterium]
MTPLLRFEDVTVEADGRSLLSGLTLDVREGEKVALVGESGSGKSTALRCVMGFVRPTRGRVFFRREEVTPRSVWAVRREVGYVPQEPPLRSGPVVDVLREPFGYRANRSLQFDRARAVELMVGFGLEAGMLERVTEDLSGGEKQRVAVVGALLLERSVVLLDEPTSALDPERAASLADYFRGRDDLTVLAVTHQAEAFADWDRTVRLPSPMSTTRKEAVSSSR